MLVPPRLLEQGMNWLCSDLIADMSYLASMLIFRTRDMKCMIPAVLQCAARTFTDIYQERKPNPSDE